MHVVGIELLHSGPSAGGGTQRPLLETSLLDKYLFLFLSLHNLLYAREQHVDLSQKVFRVRLVRLAKCTR